MQGSIWKLNKVVYGLADASRAWYLCVKDVLTQLGLKISAYNEALFYWNKKSQLQEMTIIHVDAFVWWGTNEFENKMLNKVRDIFLVGSEDENSFKYVGIHIKQLKDHICCTPDGYVNDVNH